MCVAGARRALPAGRSSANTIQITIVVNVAGVIQLPATAVLRTSVYFAREVTIGLGNAFVGNCKMNEHVKTWSRIMKMKFPGTFETLESTVMLTSIAGKWRQGENHHQYRGTVTFQGPETAAANLKAAFLKVSAEAPSGRSAQGTASMQSHGAPYCGNRSAPRRVPLCGAPRIAITRPNRISDGPMNTDKQTLLCLSVCPMRSRKSLAVQSSARFRLSLQSSDDLGPDLRWGAPSPRWDDRQQQIGLAAG